MKLHVYLLVIPVLLYSFFASAKINLKVVQQRKKDFINSDQTYLNIEDDEVITMYNIPAENWKTCKENKDCRAMSWPNNKSEIIVTGPKQKHTVIDPYTNEPTEEFYYPVKVKYGADDSRNSFRTDREYQQGFIEEYYLNPKENKKVAFYSENKIAINNTPSPRERMFPSDCRPKLINPETCGLKDTSTVIQKNYDETIEKNKAINDDLNILMKKVGTCVLMPSRKKLSSAGLNYDKFALEKLDLKNIPKIKNEQGKLMTKEDLINIDALARTLYGEMASCFDKGLQYPMSVAKVVSNRIETPMSWYISKHHDQSKPQLAKMCTTDSQFNTWFSFHNDEPNPALQNALCPVSDDDYEAATRTKGQLPKIRTWKNAVRIATETVLYPEKFKKRTHEVKSGVRYFTSNVNFKDKYPSGCVNEVTHAKVEGRELANAKCVRLWTIPCEIKRN